SSRHEQTLRLEADLGRSRVLATSRLRRPHPVAAVRAPLPPLDEVGDPDHWLRVARPDLNRASAEDRVDGAPPVAELSEVGAGEHRVGILEPLAESARAL